MKRIRRCGTQGTRGDVRTILHFFQDPGLRILSRDRFDCVSIASSKGLCVDEESCNDKVGALELSVILCPVNEAGTSEDAVMPTCVSELVDKHGLQPFIISVSR